MASDTTGESGKARLSDLKSEMKIVKAFWEKQTPSTLGWGGYCALDFLAGSFSDVAGVCYRLLNGRFC